MAIWKETRKSGKVVWRAKSRSAVDGKLKQPRFETKEAAQIWCAQMEREVASLKRRDASAKPSASFLEARERNRTLASALDRAIRLDWAGSKVGQERGMRVCHLIGMDTPIASITTETYDDIVARLLDEERSVGTIKIYCSALTVILKRALRLKWIAEPLPLTPEGRTLPNPEKRDLVIQRDWIEHHLACLELEHDRLLTEFLWHVGCRVSEAQMLTWDRVSFVDRKMQFVKTKSLNPRRIPISGDVEQLLLRCKRLTRLNPTFVFPTSYKRFRWPYKQAVKQTCQSLGLGEEVSLQWGIHTLRHTFCTRMASEGWNAVQIMQWAGHRSLKTSQNYIHGSAVDLDCLVSVEPSQATQSWSLVERSN